MVVFLNLAKFKSMNWKLNEFAYALNDECLKKMSSIIDDVSAKKSFIWKMKIVLRISAWMYIFLVFSSTTVTIEGQAHAHAPGAG